jgi:type VI secretion system protein ImpF
MSRVRPDQLLLPSILDRLIDENPDSQVESDRSRAQLLRDLKLSVRRDLENLLNTRACLYPLLDPLPEHYKQLEKSIVNYGIPDFSSLGMGGREQRDRLRKRLERVIKHFEPRFLRVEIIMVDNRGDHRDRTIRFRIEGMLHAEPSPEPVAFDSQLQPSSGDVKISGA